MPVGKHLVLCKKGLGNDLKRKGGRANREGVHCFKGNLASSIEDRFFITLITSLHRHLIVSLTEIIKSLEILAPFFFRSIVK